MNEKAFVTLTAEQYERLERRSKILEWIDADFARRAGMKLSDQVGQILDSGLTMQQMLDRFGQRVKPRRRQRPAEDLPPRATETA